MPMFADEIETGFWREQVYEMELVGDMWLEASEAGVIKAKPAPIDVPGCYADQFDIYRRRIEREIADAFLFRATRGRELL